MSRINNQNKCDCITSVAKLCHFICIRFRPANMPSIHHRRHLSYVIPAHYAFIVCLRIHGIAMRNLIRKVLAKLFFIIFFTAAAVAFLFGPLLLSSALLILPVSESHLSNILESVAAALAVSFNGV